MEWTKVTDGLPRKSRPVLVTLSEPDECIGAIESCFYDADSKEFGRVDINIMREALDSMYKMRE